MNAEQLVSEVKKFNRPRSALSVAEEQAIFGLYQVAGAGAASAHLSVLQSCNGERLGGEIVPSWRLLSAEEVLALADGLSESLDIIDDERSLIATVVPLFSTASKCEIGYVCGGRLDGQVVHLDVATDQQICLLAPDALSFWTAVESIVALESKQQSGQKNLVGFLEDIADLWRSVVPIQYPCFQVFRLQ